MEPATLFRGELDSPLLKDIGHPYMSTARHVSDIMFGKFQLMAHMGALRKYMLLGQGDIMRYLLNLLRGVAVPARHQADQLCQVTGRGILRPREDSVHPGGQGPAGRQKQGGSHPAQTNL